MATYRARVSEFKELLSKPKIDFKMLHQMCSNGIPDCPGLRCDCWRLLLNYLPANTEEWPKVYQSQRELYKQFLQEMIIQPGRKHEGGSRTDVTFEDHPLNPNPNSQWSQFFKDNEILLQIDKDTRRLQPDIGFFQQATEYPCEELVNESSNIETLRKRVEHTLLNSEDIARNKLGISATAPKKKPQTYDFGHETLPEGQEAHWEVVERILFTYAKLNPGQSYVQGMNEIVGPVYYVFASDSKQENREHAEADTFFCFTNLMSQIRDNFIKSLDHSPDGINAKMERLMTMLGQCDPQVYRVFEREGLKPEFFGFRWLTLLLSQEFPLPDVIRLWDSLFADDRRPEFLICVCCAMIVLQRDEILNGDFAVIVKLLQNYPTIDINVLLRKAEELRKYL
ncbi:TBC1 domain family member 13-like [Acanthaster planci]|uniref:TBC1 domain family member 13 n=1 Tax=Acanthaster planci TaxID=133434 RepID=A0A8B7XWA0_ACAPL|nr:TBC1 domain family member 13-like [Acanthaster planci]